MSNKLFTTVPVPKFPRSNFSLSRPVLFAPRMHKEYPTEILEIIPGDGIKIHTEAYAKSQPMVAPTFAKMDTAQESFFVPCWQLSEHFDDFITGGERGTYTDKMPFVTVGAIYGVLNSLISNNFSATTADEYNELLTLFQDVLDCLDIMRSVPIVVPDFLLESSTDWSGSKVIAGANATKFTNLNSHLYHSPLRINLLPFAAVLKIWCEFYRDENLCEDLYELYWKGGFSADFALYPDLSKATGNMDASYLGALSSSLSTWSEVLHALHGLFGLKSRAWKKDYFTSALPFVQKGPDVLLPIGGDVSLHSDLTGPSQDFTFQGYGSTTGIGYFFAEDGGGSLHEITGKVNAATLGPTIQDLRTAMRLEEMYEADGRFGNRYPENTLGQFGVRTPDSRLPRCQFLGANKQPIQIQQVVQQSATEQVSPQGNLAGLASTYGSNRLCKTYQSQHGFLVCLTAVRVHSLYEQGIHPMFSRYDRTEYAWPRFATLGEQPIYTKQLYVDTNLAEDDVFGYTPRYADYKSDTGSIHGPLKSSLNFWTMARRFGNKPVLNEEFIYGRPRQDAFVVANHLEPVFIMELDYHVRANRVLPFYGTPTL